jgi:surface protein
MATRPDPPTGIIGTVSSGTLSISWKPATTGGPVSSFTAIGLGFPRSVSLIVDSTVSTANIVATNGTSYIPTVIANGIGNAGSSIIPGAIIPVTVPGSPTAVRATYNKTSGFATITWNAPGFTGGSPILSYTVESNPPGISTIVSIRTTTVGGFTYGTPYTFTVRATNSRGSSVPSTPSASFTPISLPPAPTNTESVLISSGMNISWLTPSSTGGTPLTEYAILSYTSPSAFTTINLQDEALSSVTLSTLTNGVSYKFGVMSRNELGFSPVSPLTSSVLYYNAPLAPSPVVASTISTTSSILVTWANLPENYLISSFNVTSIPPTTVISTSSFSTVVSSLTYGTSYTFEVTATNLRGTSATATMATGVIPMMIPNPPSSVTAVAGLLRATVSWTAPTFNGGSEITAYNITPYDSSGNSGTTVSTTGTVLSTVISSLTATMPYTFGVSSRNIVGYSQSIITQTPVTVFDVPGAPTGLSVITKNTAAIVNWTPPLGNGSPISSYTFTTIPAGGSTVYYDSSGGLSAVIGSLINETTYTILMTANNIGGAGPAASTTVTPTNDIVLPAYIPNPGLVTGPRIYAQSGPYVSIFADSNFQDFSYAIPLGAWSTLSNISTLQNLTPGATSTAITGNVSVVFPEVLSALALKLNNGENFSGSKEVIYTSTSASSLLSGAGGQFSALASGDWDYARSVSLGPGTGSEMVLNITIPVNDRSIVTRGNARVILGFTFGTSDSITIDWGDSTTPDIWTNSDATHNYTATGSYIIKITGRVTGRFKGFLTNPIQNQTDNLNESKFQHCATYLRSVSSFGQLGLTSMRYAFSGCINLTSVPSTLPSSVTDISYMFSAAKSFTQNLGTWNVSNITNATGIFDNACPMLSSNGTNYPPFSNEFRTTNPYNGSYYGRTISPMVMGYHFVPNLDNNDIYTFTISLPIGDQTNMNDIQIVDWGNGIVNVYKPRENLTQTDPNFFIVLYEYGEAPPPVNEIFTTVTIYGTNSRTSVVTPVAQSGSIISGFRDSALRQITTWGNIFTNVTDVTDLFAGSSRVLQVAPVPSTVTNMTRLFKNRSAFQEDLNSWDVSNVTNMSEMFASCFGFDKPLNSWNVSKVTNMSQMFYNCRSFNQDLNSWDVSGVTNMSKMFKNDFFSHKFNGDISSWNVHNVTDMSEMFYGCSVFNKPLNSWDVTDVTNMSQMFYNCIVFNGDISSWNVTNVTNMSGMFTGCAAFNQPLNSWNVGNVTNMSSIFYGCSVFNRPLDSWNVSNVTNMNGMFLSCLIFNQNLSSWNVSKVTDMMSMFYVCRAFNQPLNSWNVSNVTNMNEMFRECGVFNQPLNSWNVSNVTNMTRMFNDCSFFNGDISSWNVSNVTTMSAMFNNAQRFNQNLSSWNPTQVTTASTIFQNTKILRQYTNYPQFSSALKATYPLTGTYYGTTVSTAV